MEQQVRAEASLAKNMASEKTREKMQNRINNSANLTKEANDKVVSILKNCTNEKGFLDPKKIREQTGFKEIPKDTGLMTGAGSGAISSMVIETLTDITGKKVEVEYLVNQKLNAVVRNLENPVVQIPLVYKKMPSVTLDEAIRGFQDENVRIDGARDGALRRIGEVKTENELINIGLNYKHYSLGTYVSRSDFLSKISDRHDILGHNSRM